MRYMLDGSNGRKGGEGRKGACWRSKGGWRGTSKQDAIKHITRSERNGGRQVGGRERTRGSVCTTDFF